MLEIVAPAIAAALVLARWAARLGLERLNQRHARAHAGAVPEALRPTLDPATYARSVEYTLARSRLHQVEATVEATVLGAALFTGILPRGWAAFTDWLGASAPAQAAFLFLVGVALALPGLPLDWHEQFRLEARFGFNTTTARLWWADRLKSLLLAGLLGYPLLVLVLTLAERAGPWWWLWAWGCLSGWQLLLLVLAPVLILPLFHKLTPLPDSPLRERLLALARRTAFRAADIQVMDGSRRSRHANAFFAGLGRARRIVLFDTLLAHLGEAEVEAVLAHEIGHARRGHLWKLLGLSLGGALAGLALLGWLARQPWFYRGFGFEPGHWGPALLLFGLLSGPALFWLAPLIHQGSRRFEYQADAFAAGVLQGPHPLVSALRRLSEANLSNLNPHPLYSAFYYSHPTLLEREAALARRAGRAATGPT